MSDIHKTYNEGTPVAVEVLHGINIAVHGGEFACLIGPSGSGKSTLLNLIGLLEWPSLCSYRLKGRPIEQATDDERTRARLDTLGFVFQFHHLLPAFSALENVMIPGLMRYGRVTAAQRANATGLFTAVGLGPNPLRRGARGRPRLRARRNRDTQKTKATMGCRVAAAVSRGPRPS